MSFTIAVGEDGYVKDKELVGIFTATFLLFMLFFTKEQPELVYVALSLFVILSMVYLYHVCVRVAIFTYKRAHVVFLQVREQNSQVTASPSPCFFEIEALKHTKPKVFDDNISVPEDTIKSAISSFLESGTVHAVDLDIETEALTSITVDTLNVIEPKILEVAESASLLVIDPQTEPLSLVESVIEPESSFQCMPAAEDQVISPEEPDSSVSESTDEIPFVSLDETRSALRAEAYLTVEYAAAYLGMSVEDFNQLVKIKFKVCGKEKFYKINTLNCFIQKESACVWTKLLDPAYQERLISEHSILTTDKAAIFLSKSQKTLSNWRDSRENSCNEPYGPDFIKVNTSVFYYIHALLAWCDSPIANKRKPRTYNSEVS